LLLQETVTDVIVGAGAAESVILADPDCVESSALVAVTLTGFVPGTAFGAV
jgi:hypothetical protein